LLREDLGMKDGLAQLLDSLARIPELKWLRFLYAYPNKITGGCSKPLPNMTPSVNTSTCPSACLGGGVEEHGAVGATPRSFSRPSSACARPCLV